MPFELATLNLVTTYEEANHTHNLKSVEPYSVDDLMSKSEVVNELISLEQNSNVGALNPAEKRQLELACEILIVYSEYLLTLLIEVI